MAKTIFATSGSPGGDEVRRERPSMAGVVLENVSRVYPGNVLAVKQLNLEVQDGELLVLVGPSGCGKSTTLRLIAGLEELSSGRILIGTQVVNDIPAKARNVAMVFQNYALYPHLNVRRNLAFGLELRERTRGLGRLWRWFMPAENEPRPAHDGMRSTVAWSRRPKRWESANCSIAGRDNCREASDSAWRWGGRWSATQPCSCSTSRCRIWTRN